jgi:hypothetical protein
MQAEHRAGCHAVVVAGVISCDEVTMRFGRTVAVDRLTLPVESGEFLGFLGPNGAGKSTTIRMLLDLLRLFGLDVDVVDQLAATASAFLLALMFGAVTLALGCATGRRTAAAGGASALAVAAYLLTSLAGLVEGLRRFRPLSPFWWYSGNDPLRNGLSALHVALLVVVTACALSVAVYTFVRRDIH